jgi:hypothetical protein
VGFRARAWAVGKSGHALPEEDDDAVRIVERPGASLATAALDAMPGAVIAPPLGHAPVEDHLAAGNICELPRQRLILAGSTPGNDHQHRNPPSGTRASITPPRAAEAPGRRRSR